VSKGPPTPKQVAAVDEARVRRTGEAVQCMKRFFDGKPYYQPYPDPKDPARSCAVIPQEVLISQTNVSILLQAADLSGAMLVGQEAVSVVRSAGGTLALSGTPTDENESAMYMRVVRDFKALEIPYDFQGGMLLLYLWLCEGVQFR
jgi:hypothetical protein